LISLFNTAYDLVAGADMSDRGIQIFCDEDIGGLGGFFKDWTKDSKVAEVQTAAFDWTVKIEEQFDSGFEGGEEGGKNYRCEK
jgi:hypothetical protein